MNDFEKGVLRFCSAVTVFITVPVVLCNCVGCNPTYSTGTRAGTINKLSYKGVFWKSWEGSMVLGGMARNSEGGMVANVWEFSTTNENLAQELGKAMDEGRPVEVEYNEWLVGPISLGTGHEAKRIKPAPQGGK